MNIISRRSFLEHAAIAGAGLGLAAVSNIPLVMRRALANASPFTPGKKLFFIFLRGANDGLNALAPVQDINYYMSRCRNASLAQAQNRQPQAGDVAHPLDVGTNYATATGTIPEYQSGNVTGVYDAAPFAIPAGNGFAALHPSLKFLAPLYNSGDLAMVHRVGYPRQSRSHFDSMNYWENGIPGNNIKKEGIFYRAMFEHIKALGSNPALTGVSFQSALPLILQGNQAPMTNLSDPGRYNLLGIPNDANGNAKFDRFISNSVAYPFPTKDYRDMLALQTKNLTETLTTFAGINFTDSGNNFFDNQVTDGDADFFNGNWSNGGDVKPTNNGYWLFPHNNNTNGGWRRPGGSTVFNKYVLNPNATYYSFMRNVKAAALVLNQTDAIIAGTEIGGWDTHNNQVSSVDGSLTGQHANLMRAVGWAIYGLWRFFKIYGKNGTNPQPGAQCAWNDLVVITLTEFGRTTVQNSTFGTDHAEAGVMWLAGGGVKGLNKAGNTNGNSGIYNCSTTQTPNNNTQNANLKWVANGTYTKDAQTGQGTLFNATGRYLQRATDFRSVLGEVLREHLGASQSQLNVIIPGYTNPSECLLTAGQVPGGLNQPDSVSTWTTGEVNVV